MNQALTQIQIKTAWAPPMDGEIRMRCGVKAEYHGGLWFEVSGQAFTEDYYDDRTQCGRTR